MFEDTDASTPRDAPIRLAHMLRRRPGAIEAVRDEEPLPPRFYRFDADEVEVPAATDEFWPLESLLLAPEATVV
jgi:hypothetical protein